MGSSQNIDARKAKTRRLVRKAAAHMGGQKSLMNAMNAIDRPDGRTTSATEVSRWFKGERAVSAIDALWIHHATEGFVGCDEFYKNLLSVIQRKVPAARKKKRAA